MMKAVIVKTARNNGKCVVTVNRKCERLKKGMINLDVRKEQRNHNIGCVSWSLLIIITKAQTPHRIIK